MDFSIIQHCQPKSVVEFFHKGIPLDQISGKPVDCLGFCQLRSLLRL